VYLTKMADDAALLLEQPDFAGGRAIGPKIKGHIGDDVTFFIFDVKPTDLPQYRVVLDEPPHELRFRNDKGSNVPDNANLADLIIQLAKAQGVILGDAPGSANLGALIIDTPTRVAIDGPYLDWKGIPA
jgi:hypothetical protein